MKRIIYLKSNDQINRAVKHLLKNQNFQIIKVPLKGLKKYLIFPIYFLYPILKLTHNHVYIFYKLISSRTRRIISYSFISPSIQKIKKRYPFFEIIQIQNSILEMFQKHRDKNKREYCTYVDYFFAMSEQQSIQASKTFAKKTFVTGLLSTEDWISKTEVASKISGYEYDLCFLCPNKLYAWKDYQYALKLSLSFIFINKKSKILFATKSKTDLKEFEKFCKKEFKKSFFDNLQIKIAKPTDISTINSAKISKIVIGSRSTALYQLGSLGMVIYPIDLSSKYGKMSGNLSLLNINLKPTKKEFIESISYLLTIEGRKNYFSKNYNVLSELDKTLLLPQKPSSMIIKFLEENY